MSPDAVAERAVRDRRTDLRPARGQPGRVGHPADHHRGPPPDRGRPPAGRRGTGRASPRSAPDELPGECLQEVGVHEIVVHYPVFASSPALVTFQLAVVGADEPDDPEQVLPNSIVKQRGDMKVVGEVTGRPGVALPAGVLGPQGGARCVTHSSIPSCRRSSRVPASSWVTCSTPTVSPRCGPWSTSSPPTWVAACTRRSRAPMSSTGDASGSASRRWSPTCSTGCSTITTCSPRAWPSSGPGTTPGSAPTRTGRWSTSGTSAA